MFGYGAFSILRATAFLLSNFRQTIRYIAIPMALSLVIAILLVWFSIEFTSYLADILAIEPHTLLGSAAQISLAALGLIFGLILAYFLYIPICLIILGPFLGPFANFVYKRKTGNRLDEIPANSPQFWKNSYYGTKITTQIFIIQILMKILLWGTLLFFPSFVILSIFFDYFTNYWFVHYENFGLIFCYRKRPSTFSKRCSNTPQLHWKKRSRISMRSRIGPFDSFC